MARTQHIITYDLGTKPVDPHREVIRQAENFGWKHYVDITGGGRNKLPNTTLLGWFETRDQAWSAFSRICDAAGERLRTYVRVEKFVIITTDGTLSDSDEH